MAGEGENAAAEDVGLCSGRRGCRSPAAGRRAGKKGGGVVMIINRVAEVGFWGGSGSQRQGENFLRWLQVRCWSRAILAQLGFVAGLIIS